MRKRLLSALDAVLDVVVRPSAAPARGVLLVSSGGIGDSILFSLMVPLFAELAEDGEPVTVLTRTDSAGVHFLLPPGIQTLTVDYPRFLRSLRYRAAVWRDLRRRGFRLAVATDHLRHPLIDEALTRACAAPHSLAMVARPWPKYQRLLDAALRRYTRVFTPPPEMCHRLLRWLDLANWATARAHPVPTVALPSHRLPPPRALAAPTVVLHPFSAIRERQYSAEVFAAIVDALPPGHHAVLSVGPGDLDRNPDFHTLANDPRVQVDGGSLRDKAALVGGAALVVAIDTSIMHLAAISGTPTLCLASAAHVVDSVPYDPRMIPANVRFLYLPLDCAGCLGRCVRPFEDGRYACIAQQPLTPILDQVREMLAGT